MTRISFSPKPGISETEADTKVATAVAGESSGLREEHGTSDTALDCGVAADNTCDTVSAAQDSLSFATAFSAAPLVVTNFIGDYDVAIGSHVKAVTASVLTVILANWSTNNPPAMYVNWIAIGS